MDPFHPGLQKVQLSAALESHFFSRTLTRREIDALKDRTINYQSDSFPEWKNGLFKSYSQYFGFLSALKARATAEELLVYGYLDPKLTYDIFDYGAGTLGAALGLIDFLKASKISYRNLRVFDADLAPSKWAQEFFAEFIPPPRFGLPRGDEENSHPEILIISDVLYEAQSKNPSSSSSSGSAIHRFIETWLSKAHPQSILIIHDPSNKHANQYLLNFRNQISSKATILLPCTHQLTCPAIQQDEWCHEERHYRAPSVYWNLVHELGYERKLLQYSLLCLGHQKSQFLETDARVVSRQLKSKGRCDRWLCSDGKRWKTSLMIRHQNEENSPYFEASRGSVVSTKILSVPPKIKPS